MTNETQATAEQEELQLLKDRADRMGIQYHPSIGLDKLRVKVKTALDLDGEPDPVKSGDVNMSQYVETLGQKKARLKKDSERLIRVRVACMNPTKAAMEGDIFTAGNAYIGMISKYVPFNADAWHVPKILVDMMEEKRYVHHYKVKDAQGQDINKTKSMKEYSIQYLSNLTEQELKDLAHEQSITNRLNEEA
jgi:hypothetical protein